VSETNLFDIITRYVLPPLLGGAGGWLTAWIGWGVKKRELLLQERRERIKIWRALLAKLPDKDGWSGGGAAERTFINTGEFASLEPHLDHDLVKRLRAERTVIVGRDFPRKPLTEVIAKLERKWGLI
jgi:hypothetical protein